MPIYQVAAFGERPTVLRGGEGGDGGGRKGEREQGEFSFATYG